MSKPKGSNQVRDYQAETSAHDKEEQLPVVGDRVRVVSEGVMTEDMGDGWTSVDNYWVVAVGSRGVVSIEVISPPFVLPTKRWAQVTDAVGQLWTRKFLDGSSNPLCEWVNLNGAYMSSVWLLNRSGLCVISEGIEE